MSRPKKYPDELVARGVRPLGVVVDERQRPAVGAAGLFASTEAAPQLAPRRVQVVVLPEREALDDAQPASRPTAPRRRRRPAVELDDRRVREAKELTGQRRQDMPPPVAEGLLEDHYHSTIGRTSTGPPRGAAGIRAASSITASRSSGPEQAVAADRVLRLGERTVGGQRPASCARTVVAVSGAASCSPGADARGLADRPVAP
jgi:hypothetical protein